MLTIWILVTTNIATVIAVLLLQRRVTILEARIQQLAVWRRP